MPTEKEKEILSTIINKYREMPYLWQKNHIYYKHKTKREAGFDILLKIYKEHDEYADKRILKKKIDNLRTGYMKEFKKVTAAKQTNTVYKPILWYYDAFRFLEPQMAISCSVTATDPLENAITSSDDENDLLAGKIMPKEREESEDDTDHKMYLQISSSDNEASGIANSASNNKRKKKAAQLLKQENVTMSTNNNMTIQKEKEWEIYGRSIGVQIKDLNKRQLTIAQKLISDVIFYANLDRLTEASYVGLRRRRNQTYKNSPPSHYSSPSPSH